MARRRKSKTAQTNALGFILVFITISAAYVSIFYGDVILRSLGLIR